MSVLQQTGHYCTPGDVQLRLTRYGFDWRVDLDTVEGQASSDEITSYVVPAVEYADSLIDAAIQEFVDSLTPRPDNNWLRDRAIDIACYRVCTLGGANVPESILRDYKQALEYLRQVKDGELTVPGLTYDADILPTGRYSDRLPLVANVF